ncbi:MAG: N-acetyltransferase [Hyphomonadaceae bacterium]
MIGYRIAEARDAGALAAFAAQSFVDTFGHLYPPEDLQAYLAASYAAEAIAGDISDPSMHCALALDENDEIVGYAMSGPLEIKAAPATEGYELYRLYVAERVKGAGVARQLMDDVLTQARASGAGAIWLSVWENNERAQRFYRGYGFEHVGEHKFMVGRIADRDFIWRLMLS